MASLMKRAPAAAVQIIFHSAINIARILFKSALLGLHFNPACDKKIRHLSGGLMESRVCSRTGIVVDERYLRHDPGAYHPEASQRLEAIYEMLETSEMRSAFTRITPRMALVEEIEMIHRSSYIARVAATAGKKSTTLDPDTVTSSDSYEVALLAAGGLLSAVDAIMAGNLGNAFALIRPPGHHAESNRSAGFCLFNNVAIAAAYARATYGLTRILIVDWDLHHGNGTQHAFYESPEVLYFSTHQYPFYPGSGSINETGRGKGEGYTINVPLPRRQGDGEFLTIYKKILEPVAVAFNPQFVLVSAGFDICAKDRLGGMMKVSPQGFAALTRVVLDIAQHCCGGRLAVTLEGGYNIEAMTRSIEAVLMEMSGWVHTSTDYLEATVKEADPSVDALIAKVINRIAPYWNVVNH